MAALVQDARQNVFDDDEIRHVERRKEEVCRWRTMFVYLCFLERLRLLSVTSSFEIFSRATWEAADFYIQAHWLIKL